MAGACQLPPSLIGRLAPNNLLMTVPQATRLERPCMTFREEASVPSCCRMFAATRTTQTFQSCSGPPKSMSLAGPSPDSLRGKSLLLLQAIQNEITLHGAYQLSCLNDESMPSRTNRAQQGRYGPLAFILQGQLFKTPKLAHHRSVAELCGMLTDRRPSTVLVRNFRASVSVHIQETYGYLGTCYLHSGIHV